MPRTSQSARWTTTLGVKKERKVIVGDSLCRKTEGPICQLDPFHRQVCCLLGTWVRDIIRRLLGVIEPSDYYSVLVVVQVGSDKVDEGSLMAVKKNFRALGVFLKLFGSREENAERNRRTHLINMWLEGHQWCLGFCNHGTVSMALGCWIQMGFCLSKSP